MENSNDIRNKICLYELPLTETNPPRIEPSISSYESLIRPGENVFCIFSETEGKISLEKIFRPDDNFQETYESTSKETDLYIVEGFITIKDNDVYLTNIKLWDVYQMASDE